MDVRRQQSREYLIYERYDMRSSVWFSSPFFLVELSSTKPEWNFHPSAVIERQGFLCLR